MSVAKLLQKRMLDEEENLSDSPEGQQVKPEEVEGLNAFKD